KRILFDISAQVRASEPVPYVVWRTERELARRLLADGSLCTVPVLVQDGSIRAIDADAAERLLTQDVQRAVERASAPLPAPGLGRRLAKLAIRRMLSLAPARLRPGLERRLRGTLRLLEHRMARNGPVAVAVPA